MGCAESDLRGAVHGDAPGDYGDLDAGGPADLAGGAGDVGRAAFVNVMGGAEPRGRSTKRTRSNRNHPAYAGIKIEVVDRDGTRHRAIVVAYDGDTEAHTLRLQNGETAEIRLQEIQFKVVHDQGSQASPPT